MKISTFQAKDSSGTSFRWAFWRDGGHGKNAGYWMIRDHEGYVRTLERRWLDSVPRIRLILSNYGLHAEIS